MFKSLAPFVLVIVMVAGAFTNSCDSKPSYPGPARMDTVIVDTGFVNKPFQLPLIPNSLEYVRLKTNTNCQISSIDQIIIKKGVVYILDKENRSLLLFTVSGNFVKKLTFKNRNVVGFDILDGFVYVLEKEFGSIYKIGLDGSFVKKIQPGLRGVQFLALSENAFLYNTAGLNLVDRKMADFRLASVDTNGKAIETLLPFGENKKSAGYYFNNQLTRSTDGIWFTPAFSNTLYELEGTSIKNKVLFDFGRYDMPEGYLSAHSGGALGHLGYVTDLSCSAQTTRHAFFSFTINGEAGFFVFDKRQRKILRIGVGLTTAMDDGHDDILLPLGSYQDRFFTVVSMRNPVLIFYRI